MADTFQNRSQRDMVLAAECVAQLYLGSDVAKIYGGLCHDFPVLVRHAGLCQALAFHESKAKTGDKGARAQAHARLLEHVARVLGVERGELLTQVQDAPTREYFFYTRRVLAAFSFFKRFAVSILEVEPGQGGDDEHTQ